MVSKPRSWKRLAKDYFSNGLLLLLSGTYFVLNFQLFNHINTVHPTAYLDEFFHVPQAQHYCKFEFFKWDDKITTFPGLYFLSVSLITPLSKLLGIDLCTVYWLRFTNLLGSYLNYYLIYRIVNKLHPSEDARYNFKNAVAAFTISLFPVLYFFTFLYYTDTISTTIVLWMYRAHLHRQNKLAAILGFVAVFMRQTNIIWVAFITILCMERELRRYMPIPKVHPQGPYSLGFWSQIKVFLYNIWHLVSASPRSSRLASLIWDLLYSSYLHLFVLLAFVAFVFINGSLVLGDKSSHEATVHLPQLFYFVTFVSFFSAPYAVNRAPDFIRFAWKNKLTIVGYLIICLTVVHFNTLVHPFVLADNRHYVFYIWKRVYQLHWAVKYTLVPVYMFGGYYLNEELKHKNIVFKLGFVLSISMCLVLQRLLEFRYFILPYMIFRLQISPEKYSWFWLFVELGFHVAINAATIYVFETKTFYWPDFRDPQRIMW